MNELVTVIIPVYQVEEYLEDCIKSVIFQTYLYCSLQIKGYLYTQIKKFTHSR